jgi:hypothetical protein
MGKPFGNALELKHLATPAGNPPAGAVLLYVKSDGKVYTKTSAGVEAPVDAAVPTNMVTTDTTQTITAQKSFSGTVYLDGNTRILAMRNDSRMGANGSASTDARYFPNFPSIFSPADMLRWKSADLFEYWDGAAWVTWSGPSLTALTDGDPGSTVAVDEAHKKWRVTFTKTAWSAEVVATLSLPYNYPVTGSTLQVDYTKDNFASIYSTSGVIAIQGAYISWYGTNDPADSTKVRFTFDTAIAAGGAATSVEGIGLWTSRPNAQGTTGDRQNVPYAWDATRRLKVWGAAPVSDAAYDLGSSGLRFKDGYFSGTVAAATLNPTNALAQSKTHASPDTDASSTALHHTLGTGANQAAAGNHTHTGFAATAHTHAAADLTSGTVATARLGSGTADSTTYLRGDGTWAVVSAGASNLDALTDVTITTAANGQVLRFNGTAWVNGAGAPFELNGASDVIVPVDTDDGWVVGSDRFDADPADDTKDRRSFFNKTKAAFRAGWGTAGAWDDANVGYSSTAMGLSTKASGASSFAVGYGAEATSDSAVAAGQFVTASGYASNASGQFSSATAHSSSARGQYALSGRHGQSAQAAGRFSAQGDAQASLFVARMETTDATPTVVTFNKLSPNTTTSFNVLNLPSSGSCYKFRIDVAARRQDVIGTFAGWEFSGVIARDGSGTRFVGEVRGESWGDAEAADWDVTLAANAGHYLAITATGEAAKTIRWVARIETTELG